MKTTILPKIFYWSRFQPDRGIDFNGFLWCREDGNVLIDPEVLDSSELELLREKGGARWILLTNADHWRASSSLAADLGAHIVAPAAERDRLGERAAEVHAWYEDTGSLPGALTPDIEVIGLHGGKSAVEMAFYLPRLRALMFGDVVRSHAAGRLMLLPDAKLDDKATLIEELKALADLELDAILLGDGDSFYHHAGEVWSAFLGQQ